jgi:uncharacterized protein (TIGR04222 family)
VFPFNLTGPQFLFFYVVFAAVVILVHRWMHVAVRPASPDAGRAQLDALTADPYKIACLREGPEEAVRVAVVNLVDRDLLATNGDDAALRPTKKADAESQRRPLDRAVLARCQRAPAKPADIGVDREVRAAAAQLETGLRASGLLLSDEEKAARAGARKVVLLLLAGVALARLAQALVAGRSNIVGLIVLAGIACFIAWKLPKARVSAAGQRALASLQTLMQRLKDRGSRLVPGGATNEAVLLAAVFGIYALPAEAFPFVEQTYPKPKPSSDSSGSSDGGGSSDSSGCGGGGGCGGCGGE